MDIDKARAILDLSAIDGLDKIKQNYRLKLRQYHPDLKGDLGQVDILGQLHDAYRLLVRYHRTEIFQAYQRGEQNSSGKAELNPSYSDDTLYIFLDINSVDAFKGSNVTVSVGDRDVECPRCRGAGLVADTASRICLRCSGSGIRELRWGSGTIEVICEKCSGSGKINPSSCSLCRGTGVITHSRNVNISIPRGTRSGTVLKLPGHGAWSHTKKCRGNLYVEINVTMPENWELNGMDVVAPVETDIWSLLSSMKVPVQTVDGTVLCSLSSNFRAGEKILIQGRGWINDEGERGNHIAILNILFPSSPPCNTSRLLVSFLRELWPVGDRQVKALPYSE